MITTKYALNDPNCSVIGHFGREPIYTSFQVCTGPAELYYNLFYPNKKRSTFLLDVGIRDSDDYDLYTSMRFDSEEEALKAYTYIDQFANDIRTTKYLSYNLYDTFENYIKPMVNYLR